MNTRAGVWRACVLAALCTMALSSLSVAAASGADGWRMYRECIPGKQMVYRYSNNVTTTMHHYKHVDQKWEKSAQRFTYTADVYIEFDDKQMDDGCMFSCWVEPRSCSVTEGGTTRVCDADEVPGSAIVGEKIHYHQSGMGKVGNITWWEGANLAAKAFYEGFVEDITFDMAGVDTTKRMETGAWDIHESYRNVRSAPDGTAWFWRVQEFDQARRAEEEMVEKRSAVKSFKVNEEAVVCVHSRRTVEVPTSRAPNGDALRYMVVSESSFGDVASFTDDTAWAGMLAEAHAYEREAMRMPSDKPGDTPCDEAADEEDAARLRTTVTVHDPTLRVSTDEGHVLAPGVPTNLLQVDARAETGSSLVTIKRAGAKRTYEMKPWEHKFGNADAGGEIKVTAKLDIDRRKTDAEILKDPALGNLERDRDTHVVGEVGASLLLKMFGSKIPLYAYSAKLYPIRREVRPTHTILDIDVTAARKALSDPDAFVGEVAKKKLLPQIEKMLKLTPEPNKELVKRAGTPGACSPFSDVEKATLSSELMKLGGKPEAPMYQSQVNTMLGPIPVELTLVLNGEVDVTVGANLCGVLPADGLTVAGRVRAKVNAVAGAGVGLTVSSKGAKVGLEVDLNLLTAELHGGISKVPEASSVPKEGEKDEAGAMQRLLDAPTCAALRPTLSTLSGKVNFAGTLFSKKYTIEVLSWPAAVERSFPQCSCVTGFGGDTCPVPNQDCSNCKGKKGDKFVDEVDVRFQVKSVDYSRFNGEDIFCKFRLRDDAFNRKEFVTETVDEKPTEFSPPAVGEWKRAQLSRGAVVLVTCFDKDLIANDLLGFAEVGLVASKAGKEQRIELGGGDEQFKGGKVTATVRYDFVEL